MEDQKKVDTASTKPALANVERIELDTPLDRGGHSVTHIDIQKPLAGALRGVSLVDVINLDVTALAKVLPRITAPALTEIEINKMDPADLVQLGTVVAGFLVPKSAKAEASPSA